MLKVSDYDAWLGECKAKWRVLRKKLAVVRDFVKHEAGAASARDDGGDRSGALAGAPGGGLRGALAGLRAKPRKHEGLTRWKSVKPEDVRLGDGEKLQRALVALAKLASTADGPRLRRPGDANVSLLADAEALDAGPARVGAEGAAADASALATRAFQPFEAEDMADTEEDEDDDEGDEGDEDADEEGDDEEEMDEDEDAVDAGFVAAEQASPETAPTSRRAPLALPEPSAPGADVLESADDALAAYSAGPPLPRVPERPSPSPAEAAAAAEAMPPPPPVGIRPAPTPVPELSASAVAALDAYGMSEDVDGAETARIISAEASEAAVSEADRVGFGGGVGVGPPSVPRVPSQNAQPLEDPWVTCRPVVPAPDAPSATDAGETRRNRDDPDSIGLARLARLASPREFVSRSARSALDDREKELAKALRLCEKPWMELTVAETGLILAQIKYLITRRRRKHAGGSHARVRRAGDQEDENERVDGEEDEDEGGDDEAPGGGRRRSARRAEIVCVRGVRARVQPAQPPDGPRQRTHGRQAVRVRRARVRRGVRVARGAFEAPGEARRAVRVRLSGVPPRLRDAKRARRAPKDARGSAAVRVRGPGVHETIQERGLAEAARAGAHGGAPVRVRVPRVRAEVRVQGGPQETRENAQGRKSEGVKKRGSSGRGRGGDRNERAGEGGRRDVDEDAKTTPRARASVALWRAIR
jgi:hypothetical protein